MRGSSATFSARAAVEWAGKLHKSPRFDPEAEEHIAVAATLDGTLDKAVLDLRHPCPKIIFWDVDAPATLERVQTDPSDSFRELIREYDLILTYAGGDPVARAYRGLRARQCIPVYPALSLSTHHRVTRDRRFDADLAFYGNRMPDREVRVAEFFFKPADMLANRRFLLGGHGWDGSVAHFANVRYLAHVPMADHNAFYATPLAVLDVCRHRMVRFGSSPPPRIFEAAGAGACIITENWEGIEMFLQPGVECITADSGSAVAQALETLSPKQARRMGKLARQRVLDQHTYAQRARQVEQCLLGNGHDSSGASWNG